jgi:hypothetical protein
MTTPWQKKLEAAGPDTVTVALGADGVIRITAEQQRPLHRWTTVGLTPNQAGDLAHALEEAVRKVEG